MAGRGPRWSRWVEGLPAAVGRLTARWDVALDGPATHGHCALVLPVRRHSGAPAVLKIAFPDEESEHEHLAMRRWSGESAARLFAAEPRSRALLLERLSTRDLNSLDDLSACQVAGELYGHLHVAPLPQLRTLSHIVDRATAGLRQLDRAAPIPRRLVEQAITLGAELSGGGPGNRLLHGDLHYGNVLAGVRQPWAVIDPKPVNGDPHYEIAPLIWNRWPQIAGDVRAGVRRRLRAVAEAARLDEDRARGWLLVRMVHNALWAVSGEDEPGQDWLTVCIAVAKAAAD
jgi:streptomycin 6-kinase